MSYFSRLLTVNALKLDINEWEHIAAYQNIRRLQSHYLYSTMSLLIFHLEDHSVPLRKIWICLLCYMPYFRTLSTTSEEHFTNSSQAKDA